MAYLDLRGQGNVRMGPVKIVGRLLGKEACDLENLPVWLFRCPRLWLALP